MSPPEGVLVVDKPPGPTSHDVVAAARRLWSCRAVGHAGTLDPAATGVLVLLFGEARKLSGYLTAQAKTYRATIRLGATTTTDDAEGDVVSRAALPGDLDAAVRAALDVERARRAQRPPAVSAVRVSGRRAHALARAGAPAALPDRPVSVERLELVRLHDDRVEVELTASKGYYVRSFARDLGQTLGVGAHVAELRRLASGAFTLEHACAWPPDSRPPLLETAAAAAKAMPTGTLTDAGALRARSGRRLTNADFSSPPEGDVAAWLDPAGRIVAIGAREGTELLVRRGFR